jgi:hypothetical protein
MMLEEMPRRDILAAHAHVEGVPMPTEIGMTKKRLIHLRAIVGWVLLSIEIAKVKLPIQSQDIVGWMMNAIAKAELLTAHYQVQLSLMSASGC